MKTRQSSDPEEHHHHETKFQSNQMNIITEHTIITVHYVRQTITELLQLN